MKDYLEIMRSAHFRSLLVAVPVVCLSAGCNSATDAGTTAQAPTDSATSAPTEATRVAATDKPAETTPKDGAVKGAASKADPKYKIVDPRKKFINPQTGQPFTDEEINNDSRLADLKTLLPALEHVKVPPPPKDMKVPDKAKVVFETSKGKITVELNGKEAPLHTKSFLYLTKLGFYDGTTIHRFADLMGGGQGRIAQGGDPFTKVPTTREMGGQGGPGYEIPREYNKLKHTAMALAAARGSVPNSAGSQFYFTLDAVPFLDEMPGYTVFGKVVDGKDVVLKLEQGDVVKKVTIAK